MRGSDRLEAMAKTVPSRADAKPKCNLFIDSNRASAMVVPSR
jgi:hypothetical protein